MSGNMIPIAGKIRKELYRKLSLWTWPSHETSSDSYDTRPGDELWTIQENGDFCYSELSHI
ncbi:hypothetical protein PSHT_10917 [Puccinia striiformis]|uniref:Uncharacterized protein n=1 Tax=Puccinia striiformis TaxID=27350 RepID=A0A2S4V6T5_9BASI|nr:hypothetical protein PSHT_10917 [Puccinia striiformis]